MVDEPATVEGAGTLDLPAVSPIFSHRLPIHLQGCIPEGKSCNFYNYGDEDTPYGQRLQYIDSGCCKWVPVRRSRGWQGGRSYGGLIALGNALFTIIALFVHWATLYLLLLLYLSIYILSTLLWSHWSSTTSSQKSVLY